MAAEDVMPEDTNGSLMQQLMQTFRDEGEDHLQVINNALLQYERADAPEQQQEIIQAAFRAAHSLKGAARAVSLTEVQTLAHAMESVFQHVRDAHYRLSSDECDHLYDALDLVKSHLAGSSLPVADMADQLLRISGQTAKSVDAELAAPAVQPISTRTGGTEETIRISLRKLDDLMAEVGEMLISRISADARQAEIHTISSLLESWAKSWAEIKRVLKRQNNTALLEIYTAHADIMQTMTEAFSRLEQGSQRDSARLGILSDNLQDKVRRLRMIPFHTQRLQLERVVRDTARQAGKQVRFEIFGEQIELDKQVLETLRAPLVHLLTNAVVHGIECPEDRAALGKSDEGCVRIQVQQRGGEVWLLVSDDGRGFDSAGIQAAYQARYGDLPPGESAVRLAFAHGVTTDHSADEMSGRGVGLDVVNVSVASLHGQVTVNSIEGKGTTVTLSVPTSLAITRTLLVRVGEEIYALPLLSVKKIVAVEAILSIGGRAALRLDERTIPLVSLAHLLQRGQDEAASTAQNQLALIIAVGDRTFAVSVDDVLTEQELAMKPLPYPLEHVPMVAGVALQGSGQPVMVLNPGDFLNAYRTARTDLTFVQPITEIATEDSHPVVLVVDDSITTRTLERNILEAAGYQVITATDGLEALNRLQEHPIQIVISDVEMPNVNGFALTRAVRADSRYQDLPIILVTSRERDQDRQEGMMAGANAYIVKRGFDQTELLNIIDQLL
jgi:two-component system, chemotaxis family, sensor kinase CheA